MRRLLLIVLTACAWPIASCAPQLPLSRAAPQLSMPLEAQRPCALYVLPEAPSFADLEIGYVTRGAQLVACDAARKLAVDTHAAEHALEARSVEGR